MQIIDTFSGIGSFSLVGEWMGWRTVQFVEINPFGQRALKYYWPGVPIHDDIKTITAEQIINNGLYDANETTILVGGVPCQPWSTAGKRLGKEDNRDLWKETIALIGALKPEWALLENVPGLVNWNGGMVFNEVQADMEAEGYQVIPFLLPACGVNAPHKRERVWFVAYSEGARARQNIKGTGEPGITPDSPNIRHEPSWTSRTGRSGLENGNKSVVPNWQNFPTQSPVCNRDDGISDRLVDITFPKWRNESIKAMGNAIVPQVALMIFKAIHQYDDNNPNQKSLP